MKNTEKRGYDTKKGFTKSSELVDVIKRQLGLDEKVISVFKVWETVLGPLAKDARLEGVMKGILMVEATSSAHLQEISMRKREILSKINQYFGKEKVVKNIKAKLKA